MGTDSRYVVVRRTDIPQGTLQVLDLAPNESQRNSVLDTPGQTKYLNRFQNDTVATVVGAGGSIRAARELKGLAAYLIDHVEAGGLAAGVDALTYTEANAAAAAIVAVANAGTVLLLANMNSAIAGVVADTELTNDGGSASTGSVEEVLMILSGDEYVVPAGAILDTDGSTFNPVVSGSFTANVNRPLYATGAFTLSLHLGQLAALKAATFSYLGTAGAAIAVYDSTGAVL